MGRFREDHIRSTVDMLAALPHPRTGKRQAMTDKIGIPVAHDGQPVLYADPRQSVGLSMGSFDSDFFAKGLSEVFRSRGRSHGQLALSRTSSVLAVLAGQGQTPSAIEYRAKASNLNDTWVAALKIAESRFKPSVPKGPLTVLLDEPETNFSLIWQQRLWSELSKPEVTERFQVIVASHSPFCLGIKHAHYVDFQDGYRQEVEVLLRRLGHQL